MPLQLRENRNAQIVDHLLPRAARHAELDRFKRERIAGHVVHALTAWAIEHGARRLYLQVESANAPAHAFYERAGFTRSHGYHYRAAPRRGAAG